MLLHPNKKNNKKLRDVLQQLYGHLDSSAQAGQQGSHDVSHEQIIEKYLDAKGAAIVSRASRWLAFVRFEL